MPEPTVPPDLRRALAAAPAAKAAWTELTQIARRDFLSWIADAKRPETRKRRIARACSMLGEGKRRPCCDAVVPLDLHNARKAAPPAQAAWSALSSDARRDVIARIGEVKERAMRRRRIRRACTLAAAGKRRSA